HRADYENALEVLITRNSNLNEFTKGFSDLVKLPEPQLERVDILDLLKAMQTMFSADLRARGITLEVRTDSELPLLWMDRHQIDQVLINIIKNAVEAIDGGGRVELLALREGDHVALMVCDTGGGLDERAKGNLFKPFFTTKRHGQGL